MRGLSKDIDLEICSFYKNSNINFHLISALEVHAKALEFQSGVVIVDKEFTPMNNVPKSISFPEAGTGTIR
jgi:hypothetical protein